MGEEGFTNVPQTTYIVNLRFNTTSSSGTWSSRTTIVNALEGLLEVVPEILGIFEPDGKANQARGDPDPLEELRVLSSVARRARVAEGRLDVAQAGGERDVAEIADQPVGLLTPPDVERDHRPEAVLHDPAGDLGIGV